MLDLTVEQFKKYGDVQFDGVSEDNAHYALKLFFYVKYCILRIILVSLHNKT